MDKYEMENAIVERIEEEFQTNQELNLSLPWFKQEQFRFEVTVEFVQKNIFIGLVPVIRDLENYETALLSDIDILYNAKQNQIRVAYDSEEYHSLIPVLKKEIQRLGKQFKLKSLFNDQKE